MQPRCLLTHALDKQTYRKPMSQFSPDSNQQSNTSSMRRSWPLPCRLGMVRWSMKWRCRSVTYQTGKVGEAGQGRLKEAAQGGRLRGRMEGQPEDAQVEQHASRQTNAERGCANR